MKLSALDQSACSKLRKPLKNSFTKVKDVLKTDAKTKIYGSLANAEFVEATSWGLS